MALGSVGRETSEVPPQGQHQELGSALLLTGGGAFTAVIGQSAQPYKGHCLVISCSLETLVTVNFYLKVTSCSLLTLRPKCLAKPQCVCLVLWLTTAKTPHPQLSRGVQVGARGQCDDTQAPRKPPLVRISGSFLSACHGPGSLLELFVRTLFHLSAYYYPFCCEVSGNQSSLFFSTRAF